MGGSTSTTRFRLSPLQRQGLNQEIETMQALQPFFSTLGKNFPSQPSVLNPILGLRNDTPFTVPENVREMINQTMPAGAARDAALIQAQQSLGLGREHITSQAYLPMLQNLFALAYGHDPYQSGSSTTSSPGALQTGVGAAGAASAVAGGAAALI